MIDGWAKKAGRRLAAWLLILLAATAASAHPPYGIVSDQKGRVYFTDLEQVWRIEPDGKVALFRPGVEGVHVHELALAPNGDVIGVQNAYDSGRDEYSSGNWRRTPDGRESWPVPMARFAPNGSGPTLDRAGNSYVTQWVSNDDHRVMLFRRSPSGRVDLLFGDPRVASRFRSEMAADVGGLALAPDGAVIFADGTLVRRVGPGGEASVLFDGGAGATLRGLALAPDGTILIADLAGHRLVSIAPDGTATILYRGTPGWGPTGVALVGGRVLVLEAEEDPSFHSHLVRVVEVAGGKARVVAAPGSPAAQNGQSPAAPPSGRAAIGRRVALFVAMATAIATALAFSWWGWRQKGDGPRSS
jgi:hypothetical protein